MSKKDYAAVAEAVRAVGSTGGDEGTLVALVIRLGVVFGADNSAYAHDQFVEACGLSAVAA